MSKAKDLAKELYPDWEYTGVSKIDGLEESMVRIQRVAFVKGYHQAEKDLELTWEDILSILKIHVEVYEDETLEYQNKQEVCQEVLKRFKERKEK